MKICLVIEGAYPYISGGVSSWVQNLIKGLPKYEFEIFSIMPSSEEKLEKKYELPSNVSGLKTVYLLDYLLEEEKEKIKNIHLNRSQKEAVSDFLKFNESVDLSRAFETLSNPKHVGETLEFLKSTVFWEIVNDIYDEHFVEEGFTNFFWAMRSMLAPIIHTIQSEIPEADLYHSVSTGYAGLVGVAAKEKSKKPFILTEHGIYAREREEDIVQSHWVQGNYKRLWIRFFYFLAQSAYKCADEVVALFNRNRDIQMNLGAEKQKLKVISNGVDLNKYRVERKTKPGFHIGAVLRIVPVKDVKTMIQAFKLVKNEVEEAKLYLIGPKDEVPEYYDECVELAKWYGIDKDIIFTGRANVKEYYEFMDVLFLTSISEGQPLVILEAFASEIPVVATDVGACKEMIYGVEGDSYGKAGLITKPVSANEMAKALIYLYRNPDKRKTYGKAGYRRAKNLYAENDFLKQYNSLYARYET